MDYRILGPLEAFDGERTISLGGARQRAVLALLVLHGNETLTSDVIVDELWGEEAPPTAVKVLQNCVSALRKELPPETIRTVAGAYSLTLEPEELDRDRFERLLAEGRAALAAGEHADAAEQLRAALALWRGAPLSDFAYEAFANEEVARLDELHVAAQEDLIEAELALGHHDELVPELESLVTRYPLRERLRWQLMLALYRAGRQAEALEAYRAARRTLLAELGIEPGPALHELERAILAQDPALEAARRQTTLGRRPGRAAATPLAGRDEQLALLGSRARRRAGRPRTSLRDRRRRPAVARPGSRTKSRAPPRNTEPASCGDAAGTAAVHPRTGRGARRCATLGRRWSRQSRPTPRHGSASSKPSPSLCERRPHGSRC